VAARKGGFLNKERMNKTINCFLYLLLVCGASLSPAGIPIPAEKDHVTSLNGTWRFKLEQPGGYSSKTNHGGRPVAVVNPATIESFQTIDYKEDKAWLDLNVPGNWEMAGLSPATYNQPDNASGLYRLWFDVPKTWQGRLVRLTFDGVQNGSELWLNGKPVAVDEPSWGRTNYHESGWTAFQLDLTPAVKFGEKNLLAVRVTKNTRSSDLDTGDYFFLGGIHRPVTLFSVPKSHLEDVTVQTRLLAGGRAELKVLTQIADAEGGSVSMQLGGITTETASKVEAGKAVLTQVVDQPKLWSAEFPNLYNLSVKVKNKGQETVETVSKRIGIREVTITNSVLLVNGVPVKLAGICRHDVSATEGTAVGPELWRKDITLMKSANINAIRTSHYPYGSGFYDLCDELGMYVVDELPYCWCPADDPELKPAFEQRARETIGRDKNHPSVIAWAVGNENKAGRNLQVIANLVKKLDPTRPRAVSCFDGNKYKVEFSDSHYTSPQKMPNGAQRARETGQPHIYLENPNTSDMRLGADAGAYERWGPMIQRVWDVCLKYETVPGTFLWEWQDRAIVDKNSTKYYTYYPETGIHLLKVKGLVDTFRNPRPSLYEVKMVYSPVRIGDAATVSGGKISFPIENRYSFTDLGLLKMSWTLEQEGKAVASGNSSVALKPLSSGKAELSVPEKSIAQSDSLRIEFVHPNGNSIVAHRFALKEIPVRSGLSPALPAESPIPWFNLVTRVMRRNPLLWKDVDRFPAHLTNTVVEPASANSLAQLKHLKADVIGGTNSQIVGKLRAEYAGGEFSYQLDWTGAAADVQELGWAFELPQDADHFTWHRAARWTVYPDSHISRITGTATPDSMKGHLTKMDRAGMFDFNSTKYDCNWASLTSASGTGLRVEFNSKQRFHCRAGGRGEHLGYVLFVNQQVSLPDDFTRPVVGDLMMELKPGDTIKGRFRIGRNQVQASR
jgi:beta-galactosidase